MDRLLIVGAVLALVAVVMIIQRRRSAAHPSALPTRVDPRQLGLDANHGDIAVIAFSGPLCHACQQWSHELEAAGIPYRRVDVLHESSLARAYAITHTPVVLVVERESGAVLAGYREGPDADSMGNVRSLTTV